LRASDTIAQELRQVSQGNGFAFPGREFSRPRFSRRRFWRSCRAPSRLSRFGGSFPDPRASWLHRRIPFVQVACPAHFDTSCLRTSGTRNGRAPLVRPDFG
jgi:hypothetical protein